MPVNSVALAIKGLLDGTTPPGETGMPGPLTALIDPYDPDESGSARAYIWPTTGPEHRLAFPRGPVTVNGAAAPAGSAGYKKLEHEVSVWLVWFGYDSDPQADSSFPLLIDHVMAVLRSAPDPLYVTDPGTGLESSLFDVGENMAYEYVPVMSTEDQRILRYDARVSVHCSELFRA